MVDNHSKESCCGCFACYSICPIRAITMEPDEEGFWYPQINYDKCIQCNKCNSVCPFEGNTIVQPNDVIYAVKNKDDEVRMESSSGGMFSILSDYVLSNNGVVYGAKFDDSFNVIHGRAETVRECTKFRGAKYVQSFIDDAFKKAKEDIQQGRLCLFSGTPCQISGLINYLGNKSDLDNLITCDIICHGVPSPLVWRDYLKEWCGTVLSVNFRSKRNGWHQSELSIVTNDGVLSDNHSNNGYSQLYFCHYTLRPSCANCPFASVNRCGDFTIGDYWGIEKNDPTFDDDKGVSLVFVNSEKARRLFEKVRTNIIYKRSIIEDCLQPNLQRPSQLALYRNKFWKLYKRTGLKHVIKVFTKKGDGNLFIKIERKIIFHKRIH